MSFNPNLNTFYLVFVYSDIGASNCVQCISKTQQIDTANFPHLDEVFV